MKKVLLLMFCGIALVFAGCSFNQSQESKDLSAEVAKLFDSGADAFKILKSANDARDDFMAKYKAGEISAEYFAKNMPIFVSAVEKATVASIKIKDEYVEAVAAFEALQEKEGTSNTDMAVTLVLGLITGIGGAMVKGGGKNAAIGELIGVIGETVYTKHTKDKVAKLDNPIIQKEFKKYKSAEKARKKQEEYDKNVVG